MRLVAYGTLRQGERLSWIFSWALAKHSGNSETIKLSGLQLYVVGDCPGAKLSSQSHKAIVEIWELNLPKAREMSLLRMLDQMEGVDVGLYKRSYIDTPKGKALVYTICEDMAGYPQIEDWKKWQKKSEKNKMRILMGSGGIRVAIYTK